MKKIFVLLCVLLSANAFAQKRKMVVAKDGTGDFTSVQEAFNSIRWNNKKNIVVFIKNGVYKEKLLLDSSKDFVTLIGEDKFKTILTYNDHTGKISPTADTINTFTSYSFRIKANNVTAQNLTFQNDAGVTAGQAVAVEVQGDKVAFKNCRFIGNQDVLLTYNPKSRQYYENCYIEGTTDFIFGSSTAWFERCHVHSKKNSHITAASTPKENTYGYVFNDCVFTADTAINNVSLGRPWRPYASVIYIHCYLDRHIIAEGWNNWRNPANEKTARYTEYKNYGPGAQPARRVSWSRQLTEGEVSAFTRKNVFW